jgi:hypothetical protein
MMGPKLRALTALGIAGWLERTAEFSADDHQLQGLQAAATGCADDLRQVLGISPGERPTTTLRRLLQLVGARLESRRCKARGTARDQWRYRVMLDALPPGIDDHQLQQAWRDQLRQPEVV